MCVCLGEREGQGDRECEVMLKGHCGDGVTTKNKKDYNWKLPHTASG